MAKPPGGAGARTSKPPKPTARARQLQRELHETQTEIRAIRAKAALRRLKESSALDFDWVGPWNELLRRQSTDPTWWPLGGTAARRHGHYFPFFQNEQQHTLLRDLSRVLVGTNNHAGGMLNGLTSFVVGTGYKVKVSPSGPGGKANAAKLTDFLDEWSAANQWDEFQQEAFWRSREDGDELIRLFPDDGCLKVRHVWPEQLTQPPGTTVEEFGYGVRWKRDAAGREDSAEPEAYWFADLENPTAGNGEEVPAGEVVHLKSNSRTGIKVGLPDFTFGTKDALDSACRLTRNLGEGAAVREAIAFIRQHAAAGPDEVEEFRTADADFRERAPFSDVYRPVNVWEPGTVVDVPEGMEHAGAPQNPGTAAHATVVQVLLRSAGTRWNAPEWLVSGDASNMGAYTSSLVAESPFVKGIVRAQAYYRARFLLIVRKAITVAIAHGLLPGDVMDGVALDLVPPSPEVRNKLEEVQRASIEIPLGTDSRQRFCESQDRDYEQIAEENKQYADEFGQQGQPLPTDAPPDDGGGGAGAGTDFGLPESLLESDEDGEGTFGVRELSEAEAGAKAPPGKVWKEITVTRGGKQFKQKRLVNAPQAGAAKPAKKADPAETIAAVKAQLAGDPAKLTPAKVKALDAQLATLTVPQLKALKKEHDLKGGKNKADHVAALVTKAKELKKKADAEKRAAKAEPEVRAPAPAAEAPKETPKAVEAHPAARKMVAFLNASPKLSDEQREQYGRALARVTRAMPKAALDRVDANLTDAAFHPSTREIGPAMIDAIVSRGGTDPAHLKKLREKYAFLAEENIGGAYMHWADGTRSLQLDGEHHGEWQDARHSPGKMMPTHGTYAHELGHAIDGPSFEVSGSKEWQDAHATEIARTVPGADGKPVPALTAYAGSKPSEGIAEFARLVYGSDVPHAQIVAEFPKASAVFKARGLWPEQERTGPEAKMPEAFEKRIDIGKDGSHADVLLKSSEPLGGRPGALAADATDGARPLADRLTAAGDLDTATLDHVQRAAADTTVGSIGGNEYGRQLEQAHQLLQTRRPLSAKPTKLELRNYERLTDQVRLRADAAVSRMRENLLPALRKLHAAGTAITDDDGRPLDVHLGALADTYERLLPKLADELKAAAGGTK